MFNKTILICSISLAMSAVASFARQGLDTVERQVADGLASYTVVIPADQFKRDRLIELARQYLERYNGIELLNVGFYIDRGAARDSMGKTMVHFTYQQWKDEFNRRKDNHLLSAAEVLKYGGAATLRIRHSDGHIEEIEITGKNVFHASVGSSTLNLLQVTLVGQGLGGSKQLTPHFYFSIPSKITPEEAAALSKSILRASGLSKMEIRIRQDEWFIFDRSYPWRNPFSPVETAPSESEAAESAEFICKPAENQTCYQSSVGTR